MSELTEVEEIEIQVVEALNTAFVKLTKHMDNPKYVEIITETAKEWAKDCYQ